MRKEVWSKLMLVMGGDRYVSLLCLEHNSSAYLVILERGDNVLSQRRGMSIQGVVDLATPPESLSEDHVQS